MLALFVVWELAVQSGVLDFQYLPAPSAVAADAVDLLTSGELIGNTLHTLNATLIGWAVASIVGVALGVVLGLSRTAWRYSMASIEVMRAIPPITLVPIALLAFGFALRMELVLVIYVAAWPVLVNTIDGVRSVRPELLDLAQILHMSTYARIRRIILPSAMPAIVVGLRLAMSMALVLAVVAEMLGNPAGLGNALVSAQQALQPDQMFAYVFTIGLLGVALNGALRYASTRAMPSLTSGPNAGA